MTKEEKERVQILAVSIDSHEDSKKFVQKLKERFAGDLQIVAGMSGTLSRDALFFVPSQCHRHCDRHQCQRGRPPAGDDRHSTPQGRHPSHFVAVI
ncbi:MAG: hypothetical protein HYU46_24085 [Deltaproteobacteria bacterium]|nr:hypothetical protein [Deltaproteobacteria bacterium]